MVRPGKCRRFAYLTLQVRTTSCNGGPAYLWHNETPTSNHWLTLKLMGTKSNRDGIGARITAQAAGQTQTTCVRSGPAFRSKRPLPS